MTTLVDGVLEPPMILNYLEWSSRRGLRPRTVEDFGRTLTRLERHVGELVLAPEAAIRHWWETLSVGAGSRAAYLAHVSGYYRWLVREGLRADDPTVRLVRPRQHRHLPRPIPTTRLATALEQAVAPISVWLALAAYMGLRACEIATLHGEDIDRGQLLVRDGKGGRQRLVPVHPEVDRLLAGFPSMPGTLFSDRRGRPMLANTVSKTANRYLHGLGIPDTLHSLRHWFGTSVYRECHDLRLTQELMGHQSPVYTAGYAAWDREAAGAVVRRLGLTIPL